MTDSEWMLWVNEKLVACEAQMASLTRRMDIRENAAPQAPRPTANPDGTVPRGKHAGKKHTWVVTNDPHSVVWSADNGYAAGLGYSDEHVAQARHSADLVPDPRAKKKSPPPW